MYTPKHFAQNNPDDCLALIRAHPLGVLIQHAGGSLDVNHIPFVLDTSDTPWLLKAHIARANPLWQQANGTSVLVVFRADDAYISPNWYASKADSHRVVPTWNYAVAHAQGVLRVVDDRDWLVRQIETLTSQEEDKVAAVLKAQGVDFNLWQVGDAPSDFVDALLRAIIGIEIPIDALDAKFKLSQNQTVGNQQSVVDALRVQGQPLAQLMQTQLGLEAQPEQKG